LLNYLLFKAAEKSLKCPNFFDQFRTNVRNFLVKK